MNLFPLDTVTALKMSTLIHHKEQISLQSRMSTRMTKCTSSLDRTDFMGWEMYVPKKGLVEMFLFGSKALSRGDLEWIAEDTAITAKANTERSEKNQKHNELYEIYLPAYSRAGSSSIGFGASVNNGSNEEPAKWPVSYSSQFDELVRALQITGGAFRAVIGSTNNDERQYCRKETIRNWDISGLDPRDYTGTPVRTRFLLRLAKAPSARLISVIEESITGIKLSYLGNMENTDVVNIWNSPLLDARVMPDYATRILIMEPEVKDAIVGIEICEEKVKPVPMSHKNPDSKGAITIGRAIASSGIRKNVTVGDVDLRRHYQIVGQTGTGKSTLLTTLILSAIEQGHGLTFFDPHGSTIDTVIRCVPEKYADKIRVVRIGDVDNPVPLNIWDSDDPAKEERTISDLCELFSDIFDPNNEGFVGPRYERWLSTFAKASIAFLGRRASLESIAVISQSQDNMLKVSKAIYSRYPELVETIKEEYGKDKSNDFQATLNWYLCKFQRLTSVEQLRKTLGAGTNALDFGTSIDTDTVTLVDLESPVIGTHASRIVGTLLLMKLWNAAMARKEKDRTHIVVVDEAALFQTNPMPRMLAESRKFGISMVLCHQHTGQLTQEVRDALEANSANFSAFRLSPRDAVYSSMRFDSQDVETRLSRLDAYNAITTLSINGLQTAPFTLETIKPKVLKNGDEIAEEIERRSIEKLVKPYASKRALTSTEILDYLNHPDKLNHNPVNEIIPKPVKKEAPKEPDWLNKWKKQRLKMEKAL